MLHVGVHTKKFLPAALAALFCTTFLTIARKILAAPNQPSLSTCTCLNETVNKFLLAIYKIMSVFCFFSKHILLASSQHVVVHILEVI